VGNANGRNPVPLIIPCHRVVGSNGSIGGFGHGIRIKRKLINLEKGNGV
jgi:methylated-DNA-[protein]-cysteine S-methyltransferase